MDEFVFDKRFATVFLPALIQDAFGGTRGEARRLITDGGFRIEGEQYKHLTCCVMDVDGNVVQSGKRKFKRIRIV